MRGRWSGDRRLLYEVYFPLFVLFVFILFQGRDLLTSGGVFTFSPTQMYCITRQLQLPHMAIEQSGKFYVIINANKGKLTVY